MNILTENLSLERDSSLNQFDCMRYTLELTTYKKEVIVHEGNDEVCEVIKGFKLTKSVRRSINKHNDIYNWIQNTQVRYLRYDTFIEDSMCDYPYICENIKHINRSFSDGTLSVQNLIKLVYKTDKQLIKLFKNWKIVS